MQSTPSTTCAVGDIHGCSNALLTLIEKISSQVKTVVLLGDYVDRGPNSKEVISTILNWRRQNNIRIIPLMGNHDFLFLQYLLGQASPLFFEVGGLQTLASYGLTPASSLHEIRQQVPPEHLIFFKSLPLTWQDRHAIYVHAGLEPGRHLSQQGAHWCLWAPKQFDRCTYDFGKPVVFGHTVFETPLLTPQRIGIDTGAVYGGRLSAVLLPARTVISVPSLSNCEKLCS